MFEFPSHLARVTAAQGLRVGLRFMASSWRVWLSTIAALAAFAFAFRVLVGSVDVGTLFVTDQVTGRVSMAPGQEGHVLALLAGGVLLTLSGAVAGWFFSALAITGLRPGRRLTVAWVAGRGVLTFVYAVLFGLVAGSALLALVVMAAISPTAGAILLMLATAAGLYAYVRLIFVTLLIFDGHGPIEAVRESWSLSEGSFVRLAGWGVMSILIGEGLSLLLGPTVALVAAGSAPAAGAVSGAFGMVAAAYSTFFLAVLYESQRARAYPALYPPDRVDETVVSPRAYEQSASSAQRWLASQHYAVAAVPLKPDAPLRRSRRRRKG